MYFKKEQNYAIFSGMDGARTYHAEIKSIRSKGIDTEWSFHM